MRISPKEVKDRVTLLTDPQPKAMALVDHGANQTPWNVVKSAKKRKGNIMSKKGKGATATGKLTAMRFSKDKFAKKADVRAYLADKGIEGCGTVQDEDDVWLVESTEDFSAVKLGKSRSVATKDVGVTAFIADVVGKKDAEADDEQDEDDEDGGDSTSKAGGDEDEDVGGDGDALADEDEDESGDDADKPGKKAAGSKVKSVDDEPTGKRKAVKPAPQRGKKASKVEPVLAFAGDPEAVEKYDWWNAYTSDEDSLQGVLADGMSYDNVPPGMEEVVMACYYTIGNIFSDGDLTPAERKAKLAQMGGELAAIAFGLGELFDKAVEDTTKAVSAKTRKAAAAFVESFGESIDAASEGSFELLENAFKADDEDDEGDDDAKGYKKPKKTNKSNDNTPDIAAMIENAVKKATGPLTAQIATLTEKNEELTAEMGRASVRRSMSDSIEDLVDEDELEAAEADEAERLEDVRRALGGRPRQPAPTF